MAKRRTLTRPPAQPGGLALDDPFVRSLGATYVMYGGLNWDFASNRPLQSLSSLPIPRADTLDLTATNSGAYRIVLDAEKTQTFTMGIRVRMTSGNTNYCPLIGLMYDQAGNAPYGTQIDLVNGQVRFAYSTNGNALSTGIDGNGISGTYFEWIWVTFRSGYQGVYRGETLIQEKYDTGVVGYTSTSVVGVGSINADGRTPGCEIEFAIYVPREMTADERSTVMANPARLARNPRRRTIACIPSASAAIAKPAGVAAIAAVGIAVASGSAKVYPAGTAVSVSIGMPVASGSASAMPAGVTAFAQVGMATGSGGSPGFAVPVGVAATMAIGMPIASGSAVAMPAGVSALTHVGSAIASGGSPGIATPSGVYATASVGAVSSIGSAKAVVVGVAAIATIGQTTARASSVATPAGVAASATVGNVSARSLDAAVAPPVTRVISDAEFQAWCEDDDAIVNILFEVQPLIGGVPTLLRWSTLGYTTPWIVDPVFYEPGFFLDVTPTEAISLKGGASIAAGNLEIENLDRGREYLKQYVWTNRPFVALVGDWRWGPADYRTIMVGQTAKLTPKDERTLALHLRDSTERLNAPLTEHKLGGDGPNQDTLYPLAFGECSNVTGLVTDLLTRSFHDGPMEAIKVVRSNALPVDFTANESVGTCELTIDNQGAAITASVQGDKFGGVYRNTIAALIQRIVTGYGKESDRFTDNDLDLDNFAAFEAAHQQKVGLWVPERMNVLDACNALASSVDARLCPSIDGKLRLIQIAIPALGPAVTILPHHVIGPLRFVEHIDAVAAIKIGFAKSWTVQKGLQTNISGEVRQLFETEWLTATKVDLARQALLGLEGDPEQRDTMLLRRLDAYAEVLRLLSLWGPGRDVYEFTGMPALMQIRVGQGGVIFNEDFGMEDGKQLQVLSAARAWESRRVTVRILV